MANNDIEAEQRLESDGDLIRIVTQHGAKGLEYPVLSLFRLLHVIKIRLSLVINQLAILNTIMSKGNCV